MKKIMLGTNWKMHRTVEDAKKYTKELSNFIKDYENIQFFIIPPYTSLWHIREMTKDGSLLVGAQNAHYEPEGAFTGEISPKMLREIGLDIIQLGHSERRQYYNENDYEINKKVLAALDYDFIPLICIGENIHEKNHGVTKEKLRMQVKITLKDVPSEDVKKIWLAYEPIWAIGSSGIPATPEYAEEAHGYIREILTELYGSEIANEIPLLYGGSVNPENALPLIKRDNIDGLFIGRSAWDLKQFFEIIKDVDGYDKGLRD
ncbi:MAG: triose-phosphate isomerase [Tissierellia bacterium]|nr:triose-phosphate isomerase [Tissierellia bacterium]